MTQSPTYSEYLLTQDMGFVGRIAAILKDEGFSPPAENPLPAAAAISFDVAAQPGIADAYHAAVISEPPRQDAATADDVITDGMLLAAVTAVQP